MWKSIILGIIVSAILIVSACNKPASNNPHPHLIFKFVFDSTQVRLNGFGLPDTMPAGHAGQNPRMNVMSAHYIELAPMPTTALGTGTILYQTPSTTAGGTNAIDFAQEPMTANNGTVYSVALDSVTAGTYQWLRVSLAYQNYDVKFFYDTSFTVSGVPVTISQDFPSTIASFVGYNTYISSYHVKTQPVSVNANKLQGYWGAETPVNLPQYGYNQTFVSTGQAPPGATTVVNPLFATSPIPAGSCVATGQFVSSKTSTSGTPLIITGHETQDIVVTISLSVNKSFEWQEVIHDGKWQPSKGENIVDMGIRGLIPILGH